MISEFQIYTNTHAQRFVLAVERWVQENIFSDFRVTAKFDWSPSRRTSRGGIYKDGPGVNMAMHLAMPNNQGNTYLFHEYPSFHLDKHIGGFYSTRAEDKLEAILVHEIAHAIQFFAYKKLDIRCKPHGPVFKQYYKLLRQQFVNPKLPSQSALKRDYDTYIAKIQTSNIRMLSSLLEA
jgi:hypothetical protein